MWKVLKNEVDLGDPTSFFDHVYMGCIQDNAKQAKILWTITEPCLNPEIPAKATEKLPCSENLRISSRSYDMEGHAKKCVEGYCELANKTTQQLYKVSTPCFDDHPFQRRIGIRGRIVKSMLSDCLEMVKFGRYWNT